MHKSLDKGYVISIDGDKLTASFQGKIRQFLYPAVVEQGLIAILNEGV